MRKRIGVGLVLGLCLGLSSHVIQGAPPPNCTGCQCAVSKAWRFPDVTGYRVLTTQPQNNMNGYGDPVSTAKWYTTDSTVYSSACLFDFHEVADSNTYNSWSVSNVSWDDNCSIQQGQGQGWVVVAVGTGGSQDALGTASRYDCGAQ